MSGINPRILSVDPVNAETSNACMKRTIATTILCLMLTTPVYAEGPKVADNNVGCSVWGETNATVSWSGNCVNGKADGYGKAVYRRYTASGERKESSYTGTMRNGMPHGHGVFVGEDGTKSEGKFDQGDETNDRPKRSLKSPITVGEAKYSYLFLACYSWDIAVQYGKWMNGTPTEIDEFMTDIKGRTRWLKENGCELHRLPEIFVGELLYRGSQDPGFLKVGENHEIGFQTDEASILKIVLWKGRKDEFEIFMVTRNRVFGNPTHQTALDLYFKSTIDFATLKKLIKRP